MKGKTDVMDGTDEARIDITGVPYEDSVIDSADVVTINGFRFVRERLCHDEGDGGRLDFHCSECGVTTPIAEVDHVMHCPACHGIIESL